MLYGITLSNEIEDLNFNDIFVDQFVFSKRQDIIPKSFETFTLDDAYIGLHPRIVESRLTKIYDSSDIHIGFVVGIAIDQNGTQISNSLKISHPYSSPEFLKEIEDIVENSSGRFIFLLITPTYKRAYFDAVADYSCVYNKNEGIFASTPSLATTNANGFQPNSYFGPNDVLNEGVRYSLKLTPDKSITRCTANHYLDLNSFEETRHWPKEDLIIYPDSAKTTDLIDAIIERMSMIMSTLAKSDNYLFALSGGRDSRCLLATSLISKNPVQQTYSHWFHWASGQDSKLAKKIAESIGIEHKIYSIRKNTPIKSDLMNLRHGFSFFGDLRATPTQDLIPENKLQIRGNVMGILRSINWRGQKIGNFDSAHALSRLRACPDKGKFSAYYEFLEKAYLDWYNHLPDNAQKIHYDLAWWEITLTHGQGTRHYATSRSFIVNPFSDRKLLKLASQIPLADRSGDEIYNQIIRRCAPKLLDFDFH